MIHPNPEIEVVINLATEKARYHNHEYVTLEHILYGLVAYEPFAKFLDSYGVDVDGLNKDVDDYLSSQTYLVSSDAECSPKKTHTLERTLNRALTQVLFSSRQQLQIIDLFISITQEHNSYAAYFILKYGTDNREDFIKFYNDN